jgi:DNA polymerase-3 subunit alpha
VADLPSLVPIEGSPEALAAAAERAKLKWNDPKNKKRVIVAGLITEYKELITKKGTRMAFAKVEDLTGTAELVIFPDTFAKYSEILKEEKPLLIGGGLEVENGNAKIMADSFALFEDVLKKTKKISVRLDKLESEDYEKLDSLLIECKGPTNVRLVMNVAGQDIELFAEKPHQIEISDHFFEGARQLFGRTDFIEVQS